MKRYRITIVDLIGNGPNSSLYGRYMFANSASIMPQAVAAICDAAGHEVNFIIYTGREDLAAQIGSDADIVFFCAFTTAALLAYSVSRWCRQNGAITVLGGPHARSYPEDALQYFDYVLGFSSRDTITSLLKFAERQKDTGVALSAPVQPKEFPGVRERWKYIQRTLEKAPWIKIVPMIGSVGCPYTCSFCIDSTVPYQTLDVDELRADLQFLATQFEQPVIAWHDPNFAIKFELYMDLLESAVKPGSLRFIAETSLSVLTEPHLRRLRENGCVALLPGIESWFDLGRKSRVGSQVGQDKLERVADHINMVLRYVPYLQTNFVLGLDNDAGAEPFELTKKFVDRCPAAFPGYSLLTSYGGAAPINLEYQRDGRVLPFPFLFLNNNYAMNVRPRNYAWIDFYDHLIDLVAHTFSPRAIYRRFAQCPHRESRWLNLMRGMSQEGRGRLKYHRRIRALLGCDPQVRRYMEGESTVLPDFYMSMIKRSLGPWYEWLPAGALTHDHCAQWRRSARVQAHA